MNPFAIGLAVAAIAAATTGLPQTPLPQTPQPQTLQPPPSVASGGRWPVLPATVLEGFEPHGRFGAGHRGVDLVAAPGQLVTSALPGEVTFAGRVAGRQVVVVRHRDGVRTTYLPVVPVVAVGTHVSAGSVLGLLDTHQHCDLSTCLHWGARLGDNYVDPLSLMAQQVVLLPPSP